MGYRLNPTVTPVISSPITESQSWIQGREFPADKPLLNMAQAVPNYPPSSALIAHLGKVANNTATAMYTGVFGIPELREALATDIGADYASHIDPAQVAITAGCNQGFCAVMTALATPGDEVILPLPYYFNHQMWLELQGIRAVHLPFNETGGAVPDLEIAAGLISPRTRAIALISPNNPTGAVYPAAVIEGFYQLAQAHGIALVLDETYKDFRSDPAPPHGLFQRQDWPETLVHLYSFSKAYSLTGYRVGSIIAGPALLHEVAKILDCMAICAPRIGQEAALFGLQHLRDWRIAKAQLAQEKGRALAAAFADPRLAYQLIAWGGFFAYIKHPFNAESATQVARRLLDQQHILCLPGSMFGPEQEDYLRFAFANLEMEQIGELVERLV